MHDNEPIKYRKDFMKIKFEPDDDFPLGKTYNDNCCCICS